MTATQPSSVATWLLKHLGRENEALAGDLLEEFRRGRSVTWFWRQVLTAILMSRSRAVLLTVGILVVYWMGHYIPIPGANTSALAALARGPHWSTFKYDLFTGGNLEPVTILALGVMPYVSASICVQVMAWLSSSIRGTARLAPRRMRQYTWVVAIVLCMVQAYGLALFLERQTQTVAGLRFVYDSGWVFRLTTVATLTSGTAGLMWLSDYITARGIGNGMFLMVLAGVLGGLPSRTPLLSTLGHAGLADSSTILACLRVVVSVGVVAITSHFYRRATESEQLS